MTLANAPLPAVADIPDVPTDEDQELVFQFPWEAKAFAIVVNLYQAGHFTWPEWAEQLGEEIRAAGAADDGSGYYLLWLAAAEKLVAAKDLCQQAELAKLKSNLEADQGGPVA